MTFAIFIPLMVLALLGLCGIGAILCRSCRRRGGPVGFLLLVAAIAVFAFAMRRVRTDFGGWPRIERVAPASSILLPTLSPSTPPTTQASEAWVSDWGTYLRETSFKGFRAESSDTCVTPGEAVEQAIRTAAERVYAMVKNRPELANRPMLPNRRGEDLLMQELVHAIASEQLIVDQTMLRTEKSYGTLWKSYLLIDTSPQRLNPLVKNIGRTLATDRRQTYAAAGSIAATMVVVLLLYAFLNTVTKGYFIWRLRATALLLMIVVVMGAAVI